MTKKDKFCHCYWEKWAEEVLADHMRGMDFVFKMLSFFLSPFHIRNLILSEEQALRFVPVGLETFTGRYF